MFKYCLFLAKLKRRGRPSMEIVRRGASVWNYPYEHLVVIKDEKVRSFVKFETILPLLSCFLDHLTNKHSRAWSSILNLWLDFRTCQKYRTLLSPRQRSNNCLEVSKENVSGNMMLSHWPCFSWKFFMIWFHKILKLIFQKQPSCPRNNCTGHWRKLPNLRALLEISVYL